MIKPIIRLCIHIGLYTCYEKKNLAKFPGFGKTPYDAWVNYYSKPAISGYPYCGLIINPQS